MTDYSAAGVLERLYDFQRATVDQAFRRLYVDSDSTRRFLIADETGLGKTHVAGGIIAKTIERLQHVDEVKRIDIVYVCSSQDIAEQNLRKLLVTSGRHRTPATRLTLLVAYAELLQPSAFAGKKPVTIVAFTPSTSFEFGGQTGRADERAVLFCLLSEHLRLKGASKTSLKRILLGGVSNISNFQWYIDNLLLRTQGRWEPGIRQAFLSSFDRATTRQPLDHLINETSGRSLNHAEGDLARGLVAELRRLLAQASIQALEQDLVILDEFQRFRYLLTTDTPAGELAGQLFLQPDARVLLLSATPYKPFTFAEEAASGEDHYVDFLRTLDFLANGSQTTKTIRSAFADLRRGALAGQPVLAAKTVLEEQLRRLMCRTERPQIGADGMLGQVASPADDIEPIDLTAYVALHRLAVLLDAPLSVEYWKSAPYFGNFLAGYKAGEKLKEALKEPAQHTELLPILRAMQRLQSADVRGFERLDWGNARLRRLASETVDAGWWRLLWVPPSLPYHELGGPYASKAIRGMTKRLIFSSWVAAPTAIASLLSYDVERRIHTSAGPAQNTPEARRAIASRLAYRLDGDRPASMTALALFWPSPTIAMATDPLIAAQEIPTETRSLADILKWAEVRVAPVVGPNGTSQATASTAWHWAGSLLADAAAAADTGAKTLSAIAAVEALRGAIEEEDADASQEKDALAVHVDYALAALNWTPQLPADRPTDLTAVIALMGLGAPGNIAWRALRRLPPPDHKVSEAGLWRAAAVLASGVRSLFNRAEVTLLLSQVDPGDETAYWQVVARYCLNGDLQAVLDEYLHHLAESSGYEPGSDSGLLEIANAARRALSIRAATYVAADPAGEGTGSIPFLSRFALRFGNIQQQQDDVRLPEVRAAFNSPFWPVVLASTSIGQEGIDLHWWCHAIVHWNLPANPVDFEQREGRINRFKGHAVRRNVATKFRQETLFSQDPNPWKFLFEAACDAREANQNDLQPYWVFAGDACIQRQILSYPLSRDGVRWDELQQLLALYRLSLGQPRQEDMVALLASRGLARNAERLKELQLDLRPMSSSHR
jgi:hypothetical protein